VRASEPKRAERGEPDHKALSDEGNPEFATVLKVMRALGLKLKVAAAVVRDKASAA
jgi:hypothetical protein